MNKQKSVLWLLPRRAYIALALVFLANMVAYYGSKLLNTNMTHFCVTLPLDDAIPFYAPFIGIYVLALVQWIVSYLVAACDSKKLLYEVVFADLVGKLIAFVIFLAYPTEMIRPEVIGGGFWNWLTRFIYANDTPAVNLFPSIHCLESWLCVRVALSAKKMPRWYLPLSMIMTVGVFASVIFVKQHVVIDIIGGVAVAEIGLLVSRLLHGDRLLSRLEPACVRDDTWMGRRCIDEKQSKK